MAQAIALSHRNLGFTGSNPSVGCVIVRDDGDGPVVVASAVTAPGGRPHAETEALKSAGDAARGATVYVTLEPCSHFGHTPPCADALVAAGVRRVVIGVIDPDSRVSGRGVAILRAAGILVTIGVLAREGERTLEAYLMRKRHHRPFVTLKLAVSSDGMIGLKGQGQVPITGPQSRDYVHRLRAETDAILVGIGTALADDPELTSRISGLENRSPVRIVIDPDLALPLTSKLVTTARTVPVLLIGSDGMRGAPPSVGPADISPTRGEINAERPLARNDSCATESSPQPISPLVGEMSDRTEGGEPSTPERGVTGEGMRSEPSAHDIAYDLHQKALEAAGVEILDCNPAGIGDLLAALAKRGISSLLVEGGAKTAQAFMNSGQVDRILLFTGPRSLGTTGVASPLRAGVVPTGFVHHETKRFGDDILAIYERAS